MSKHKAGPGASSGEQVDIGEIIDRETAARLAQMQSPDYVWPERISRGDVIAIVAAILVCAVLIALCMWGVIS